MSAIVGRRRAVVNSARPTLPGRTTIDTLQKNSWIKSRREDLGRFLRQHREQLRPAEQGGLAPSRRRVRGLRRDEVAVRADIGLSWYTMLEQGRVENVSPQTLAAVARALCLSGSERQYLFALAARSFEELNINESAPPSELISFVRTATFGMIFILSPLFEVIAYNTKADQFFRFSAHGPNVNLLRIMLSDVHMPVRFIQPNWATVLASMVGHFRLWFGRIGSAAYDTLIVELRTFPQFSALWDCACIAPPPSERALLRLPEAGPFLVKVMAFTSFTCPTYTIITKTLVDRDLADVESAHSTHEYAVGAPDLRARDARRRELGAFLRSRRECSSPEQDGFPPMAKRRTKGLRRHEVAKRAGIGLGRYATLEQGRIENIAHKTLWAVADALELTHRERQYIERLSSQAFDDLERLDGEVPAELLRLVQSFPDAHAHFHNANFDMLAWNADAEEFYEYSQFKNPNMLRTMARNPRLRRAFVSPNWEESLARMLAHYRFTAGSLKATEGDSIIAGLVRESAEFARIWRSVRSVGNPGMEAGTLDYPIGGRRQVQVLILTPTSLPTHTLILKIRSDSQVTGTSAALA